MTQFQPQQAFTFGVVADVQYANLEPNLKLDRYFNTALEKLNRAIDTFNQSNIDFVLDLGDLIDRHYDSYPTALQAYSRLNVPRYQLAGNHDFMVTDSQKVNVPQALQMPALHYSFVHKGITFIALNGNDISLAAHPPGTKTFLKAKAYLSKLERFGKENARQWNSAISYQQLDWMKAEIEKAAQQNMPVVVACHQPVFPLGRSHNLWNDHEVVERLEKHNNVIGFFNGHDHRGHYALHHNIHFINFKGMIQTPTEGAYAITTIQPGQINVQGFERQPSMKLGL